MGELTQFFIVIASVVAGWAMGVVGMMRPAPPDEDEPIRISNVHWYPKAKNPPPRPPAPPPFPLAPVSRPPETRRTANCATH